MKKKKNKLMQLILLLLIVHCTASLQAQVRVGGSVAPNSNAVLDLNANDTANGLKGLLLPRVALVSTANATPLKEHIVGMLVYNTATSKDVLPGPYYNDGAKWIRGVGVVINTEPASSNLREARVEINESISTQSMLYHGEIIDICSSSTIVSLRGVFSNPQMAQTSFSITPLLKRGEDGKTIVWSLQIQNSNFNPDDNSILERVIAVYESPCDEELPISYLGTSMLVGW